MTTEQLSNLLELNQENGIPKFQGNKAQFEDRKVPKTLTGDSALVDTDFESPPEDPLTLLAHWFREAERIKIRELKTMSLATIDRDHNFFPSSRIVLIKNLTSFGLTFGSSKNSKKGREMHSHPYVSGNIYWHETLQQICFSGNVTQLSSSESDLLFNDRPRNAKAVAVISHQSKILSPDSSLKKDIEALTRSEEEIKRPKNWHGYNLSFNNIEFWVGNPTRIHQRLFYERKVEGSWKLQWLQP